ncbi:MAG: hypothetical protein H7Z41_08160, partial [Cytophagales bacterium]|nr:hypothetical protein [Armatimonadota bacterium]
MERETLIGLNESFAGAVCPEDVFGRLCGSASEQRTMLRAVFAKLSRSCHPDLVADAEKPVAEATFSRLTDWKQQADLKLAAGTYGDRRP